MKFAVSILALLVAGASSVRQRVGFRRDLRGSTKKRCPVGMSTTKSKGSKGGKYRSAFFERIATFPICSQIEANCNTDITTVAEIVTASKDGYTLIYSDSEGGAVGFIDITDPSDPVGRGTFPVEGEPTSVAVVHDYAIVVVNKSPNFTHPAGELQVIDFSDVENPSVVATIDLGGQPDSVAVSPDGNYVAVAIENERDEEVNDGALPQLPAGFLQVIDTSNSDPKKWNTTKVDLTGFAGLTEPSDPEPEFVSINSENKAVVSLQENNGIVIVDLVTKKVINNFSAGTVDLTLVDTVEDDIINQTSFLMGIPREPDGIVWLDTSHFATADEGDLEGGSRGFTIFDKLGNVVFTSGNQLEHLAARIGHYNEGRSENKGNEPENVAYGVYEDGRNVRKFLFVNSERSNFVAVYDVKDPYKPEFVQVLPTGVGPEGALAIPQRNLLVVASEVDERESKIRSTLTIYQYGKDGTTYPTIESDNRNDKTPIPWGALSGLAADPEDCSILYAVEDSFYKRSRMFVIDTSEFPARLTKEISIKDTDDILAAIKTDSEFNSSELAALINDDKTVNLDLEGIAVASEGGFWLVSEGSGTVKERPIESRNFLLKVKDDGTIIQVVNLPDEVNAIQSRFGFEGVAEGQDALAGKVVVAFQRAWVGEDQRYARLGIYDIKDSKWHFVFYPLDAPESQNGGWVGISDIAPLPNGKFKVLERDDQGGPDGEIKRIYDIDLTECGITFNGTASIDVVIITKTLDKDLVPYLLEKDGLLYEKVEGLAINGQGTTFVVNDNDGVDDNSGETCLLRI